MSNPITSVFIKDNNVLEIRDPSNLASEFSVETDTISITFAGLELSSSADFRNERISTYYFNSYDVTVGKPVKGGKNTKEVTKLTKEIEKLNSALDAASLTIEERDNTINELTIEVKEVVNNTFSNSEKTALLEEIDRLKADIVKLSDKQNNTPSSDNPTDDDGASDNGSGDGSTE